MAKTIRKILSAEEKRFTERVEHTRNVQTEQIQAEMQRESTLLKPDGDYAVTDAAAQSGRMLSREEIMRRLKRLNPSLSYETSFRYPDHGGIYVTENRIDPVTGKSPWKRFVCGIPSKTVREFALRLTVPKVIPDPTIALHWRTIQGVDQQVPGWRSILLKLIIEDLITPSGAEKEFQITRGRSSQRWQEAVN